MYSLILSCFSTVVFDNGSQFKNSVADLLLIGVPSTALVFMYFPINKGKSDILYCFKYSGFNISSISEKSN